MIGRLRDAARLSCRVCGEHPAARLSRAILSGLRPGTGVHMPVAQRKHRRTGALLPASRAGELLTGFAVHNHVDHLCKTAPGLCAYWEMLGIVLTGPRL